MSSSISQPTDGQWDVTVVVPTLNGGKTLPDFFQALKMQSVRPREILVCDSSSDDDTEKICRHHQATFVTIAREKFDHGGTRSFLVKRAKGKMVVFLTQDAILATDDSLRNILVPLMNDPKIACCFGRQLPARDATFAAAHLRRFNYPENSYVRCFDDRKSYGLKTAFISNSFAAYKKECLAEVDYFKNGLIFGEDTCTLGRLLLSGYCVSYRADAAVYHSHNYSLAEEFRRSFDIGVLHSEQKWLPDTFGRAEKEGDRYVRSALAEIFSGNHYLLLGDWLCRNCSKLMGYKLGRHHRRLPPWLRPQLSMNRAWWEKGRNRRV
ncbi:glycosyltransferase family 2 protein [Desulforhopalus singaporensis]|uniref:Rhamnosyltransferase n=1 Tax=Desulforhopalus singaporensis TaxID=91360 RepID=A0A1H0QLF0_9BACT|nr:glycosyltransferase family A protein [Desulforhopalus singaporensis]SDP18147.1 rhamnosyltransferase [Desulforhopalus singaporensis]